MSVLDAVASGLARRVVRPMMHTEGGTAMRKHSLIDTRRRAFGDRHALQCLFLDRLHRIAELRRDWVPEYGEATRRQLDHALYSTYMDCLAVGLRPVARAVIADVHR